MLQSNFLLRGALETFLNETLSVGGIMVTMVKSQSLLTDVNAPIHMYIDKTKQVINMLCSLIIDSAPQQSL